MEYYFVSSGKEIQIFKFFRTIFAINIGRVIRNIIVHDPKVYIPENKRNRK